MAIIDTRALRAQGAALVRDQRAVTRNLVLIHCGVLAALSLGSNALNLVLDSQVGTTGGLDGMGLRSVLQSIQQLLVYVNMFFGPFWSAGFLYAMLGVVRLQTPKQQELLEGFRRFGRVLMAALYEMALIFSLVMTTFFVADLLYGFTPWGQELAAIVEPINADLASYLVDGMLDLSKLPVETITGLTIPLMILWTVLLAASCIYFGCCFRMSPYLMMERKIGGVASLFLSRSLMRGHKWQLLKLDLRFWWYHALCGLVSATAYLDVLLPALGISIPISDTAMLFVTLGLYSLLMTALYLWKKCDVDAAYLLAYEAIAHPLTEEAPVEAE